MTDTSRPADPTPRPDERGINQTMYVRSPGSRTRATDGMTDHRTVDVETLAAALASKPFADWLQLVVRAGGGYMKDGERLAPDFASDIAGTLFAALPATPAEPLDVEALAHAFNNVINQPGFLVGVGMQEWSRIAAEYAALTATEPREDRLRDLLSRAIALLSEWTIEVGDTEPRDANTVRLIYDIRAALHPDTPEAPE